MSEATAERVAADSYRPTSYFVDESDLTWRVLGTLNVFRLFIAVLLIALYFATDNETTGRLEIGTLNQNSGAYSFLQVIDPINVTGTVSLDAEKKGINMSRIMRTFYKHAEETFSFDVIERALDGYKTDLESFDARIQMRFSFPMRIESLRSGLSGYQYYDIALELVERDGIAKKIVHLDYVYSSTCPCSLELSEHARQTRGQLATPHSQRSVARLSVVLAPGAPCLWFEDLIDMARRAVPTETQVMVKREDEQAFAELNAANPIFVEDAARLFCAELRADDRIGDFRVIASHQESLHSHDAVSVLHEGETFAAESLDPRLFQSLFHVG